MPNPVLRPVRPDDLPSVEALLAAEQLPSQGIGDLLDTFWVLDRGGRVVGSVGLEVYDDVALLRSLVVESSLRKKGFGDLLMQAALGETLDRNLRRVYLFTVSAAPFFAGFGFQECTLDDFELVVRDSFQYRAVSSIPDLRSRVKGMRLELRSALSSIRRSSKGDG